MNRFLSIAALWLIVPGLLAPALVSAPATPEAHAVGSVAIAAQSASIDFPAGITFALTASADFDVSRVQLIYHITGQPTEYLAPVPLATPGGSLKLSYQLDLQANFLPAGIDIVAFWRFLDASGRWVDSQPETVHWYDNRYTWSTISMPDADVSYHGISPAFAKNVATSTQQSIDSLKTLYGLGRVTSLRIWIYPNTAELSGSRQQNTREAVAGLSYPQYGLITAAIPNGDATELGRVMPHEVSHQLLYQATRNPWNAPPLWLDEGLATYAQSVGTDGFMRTVEVAESSNRLLGLAGLTLSFPFSPATADLAYAESFSVVTYIVQTYGKAGVTRLARELARGQPYDQAFQRALGRTMTQLEADWRVWIANQPRAASRDGYRNQMRRAGDLSFVARHRW